MPVTNVSNQNADARPFSQTVREHETVSSVKIDGALKPGSPVERQSDNTKGVTRFRKMADFIVKLMPRTSKDELGVKPQYWLEMRDIEVGRRDRMSLNGLDAKSGALAAWKNDTSTKQNLLEWMDNNPTAHIKPLADSESTYPLSEKLCRINYLSACESLDYRIEITSNGKFAKSDGTLLDTTHLPGKAGMAGHAAIVIHRDGNMFVHPYEKGTWQHTSTTRGAPVISAGMLKVERGEAKSFHLDSGHYAPTLPQLKVFLARLSKEGVNIRKLEIHAKNIDRDTIESTVDKCSRTSRQT
ncbi:hypothetical protein [Burkholderia ubonensis]|uniref:hypothetical protein n=1 Tax=Burkholderia ubonensis TaxID=101571 RepID=UPI0012F73D18|nr:hypothetical protein [Burkholderia ubonensis]